jgi:hypothetical protein
VQPDSRPVRAVDDHRTIENRTESADRPTEHVSGETPEDRPVTGRHNVDYSDRPEEPPHKTPNELTKEYLTEVVDHKVENPRRAVNHNSFDPDDFRPGCPDHELPGHLTRSMPDHALDDASTPIDPHRIIVTDADPEIRPIWRDLAEGDAFLDAEHALFRLDSRGPEIFRPGFQPRNRDRLDISGHSAGRTNGFVSLSNSPENAITRDTEAHPEGKGA